jgi:hypothetical protein
MQPESFAQTTLNAVAQHGLADSARNGKTQPRTIPRSFLSRARQTERGKERTGEADAVVIDFAEVGRAQIPGRPGEP